MATTGYIPAPRGAGLLHLAVGRPVAPPGDCLHVMDGDGASLCERIDADDLVEVHELRWRDVPTSLRCPTCRTLMRVYAAGTR